MEKSAEASVVAQQAGASRVGIVAYSADLISLMKPRVISLLLVSTCCPMILAAGGNLSLPTVLWALVGGALVSGSAGAINCIWDRDIDAIMSRTQDRALAQGRVSPMAAAIFAFLTGTVGLVVLAVYLNTIAALIALGGHLFYVIVYTLWLKRTTPQNIVIGGAAGAVPPLVGWAAVTGGIDVTAFLLFLLVFLWTPPHFWALALNKNDDYTRAGVPMLPVVAGEAVTHSHMLFYAITLIPVSVLLVLSNESLGMFSLVVMLLLGVVFVAKIFQLKSLPRSAEAQKMKKAWDVFGFSLIYLSLFFACLVIDSVLI